MADAGSGPDAESDPDSDTGERRLSGTGVTPRSGVGTVVWHRPDAALDLGDPPEPDTVDPVAERERFHEAVAAAREELEAEAERARATVGDDEADVLDAHVGFLTDPQVESGVEDATDEGLPAEFAVREAFATHIETFEGMEGRMAERADDLRDVRDRLLRHLLGVERTDLGALPEGTVLLAERLTPSDTVRLDPDRVAGLATMTGGRTAHAAIIARSLGLPAVVGVGDDLESVAAGSEVVVDGEAGVVVLNPSAETRAAAEADESAPVRHERVQTTDGKEIEVAANVGNAAEAEAAADRGADGVGLYRTEFLFLDRDSPPDEDEQYEAYVVACEAFSGGSAADGGAGDRVVVRTLDVGGDKDVPYMDLDPVENGFLGERGIRLSLGAHADLFETQLRALLRAAGRVAADPESADLAVMFPLVRSVEELDAALERVESVAADLDDEGVDYARPELGAMVETPAAALTADRLADRVDFLSVGTNDLAQYVMAASRDVDAMDDLRDPLYPAVLRALARTVEGAHAGDAWVGVCGEMAGDPQLTELLVGLGVDELSMGAVTVPDVKARVADLESAAAAETAERALAAETRREVRETLGLPEE
ncbi:phosphoenolpyruvate--protein phosphotransferase [Halobium salinum]|uniref:Phosphoenolpyruvate-protein phosphotransferase n=1 Tax=Halobium salinum TaxID=1364940 RepID=A0ABD5PCL2_9EURY|nr:phosphoenolpyruvate--protein phosphotransferase [Halobium salinum]